MNDYNMSNPTIANIKRALASAEMALYVSEASGTTLAHINYVALKTLVKVARAKLLAEFTYGDNKNDKV